MRKNNSNHYDAHCPKCRRANTISRQRMELFYPNWQNDVDKLIAEKPKQDLQKSTNPSPASVKKPVTKQATVKKKRISPVEPQKKIESIYVSFF